MSPRTAARACTTGAVVFTAIAIWAVGLHPLCALPFAVSAAVLWVLARAYRQDQRHDDEQAERLARPFPDPQPVTEQDLFDAAFNAMIRNLQEQP